MRFKYLRTSRVFYKDKYIDIEVWEELDSGKLCIIDAESKMRIDLNGAMGEEL